MASWELLFEKNGLNGQLKLPSLFLGKVTISPVNELCEAIIIQITSMVVLHDIETCNQISFYLSDSLTLKICVRQQSQHRFSLVFLICISLKNNTDIAILSKLKKKQTCMRICPSLRLGGPILMPCWGLV